MPTKTDILDLYFMDARYKLIDIAAFLDRLERAEGHEGLQDVRVRALKKAIPLLIDSSCENHANRAERMLELLSDHTTEPTPAAHTQSALGADPNTDY